MPATLQPDWSAYAACRTCSVAAGMPCVVTVGGTVQVGTPHPERCTTAQPSLLDELIPTTKET